MGQFAYVVDRAFKTGPFLDKIRHFFTQRRKDVGHDRTKPDQTEPNRHNKNLRAEILPVLSFRTDITNGQGSRHNSSGVPTPPYAEQAA